MAEQLSRGFDQTCGRCQGQQTIQVETVAIVPGTDNETYTCIDWRTCPACGGAGRIAGQSQ